MNNNCNDAGTAERDAQLGDAIAAQIYSRLSDTGVRQLRVGVNDEIIRLIGFACPRYARIAEEIAQAHAGARRIENFIDTSGTHCYRILDEPDTA